MPGPAAARRFPQIALDERPDLRAAFRPSSSPQTNHKLAVANGSTDPTFGAWYTYNPSINNPNGDQTLGVSVNIPLRIFDRNQGEKKRTLIDIDRSQDTDRGRPRQVFSDVDSAYARWGATSRCSSPTRRSTRIRPLRVRDTVTYSYQHGGASLMDFLNAQSDYRTVQLAYLQLIGSYLTAAGQLNLAVGREVIQ